MTKRVYLLLIGPVIGVLAGLVLWDIKAGRIVVVTAYIYGLAVDGIVAGAMLARAAHLTKSATGTVLTSICGGLVLTAVGCLTLLNGTWITPEPTDWAIAGGMSGLLVGAIHALLYNLIDYIHVRTITDNSNERVEREAKQDVVEGGGHGKQKGKQKGSGVE